MLPTTFFSGHFIPPPPPPTPPMVGHAAFSTWTPCNLLVPNMHQMTLWQSLCVIGSKICIINASSSCIVKTLEKPHVMLTAQQMKVSNSKCIHGEHSKHTTHNTAWLHYPSVTISVLRVPSKITREAITILDFSENYRLTSSAKYLGKT